MKLEEIYQQEDIKAILQDIENATAKIKSAMDNDLGVNFIIIDDSSKRPIPLQRIDLRVDFKLLSLYNEIRSVLYNKLEVKIKEYLISYKPTITVKDLILNIPEEGEYHVEVKDSYDMSQLNVFMEDIIKMYPHSEYLLTNDIAKLIIEK